MIRISTGLKAAILGNYGLSLYLNKGVFDLYTGTQPDSADLAVTGSLLGRITNNGDTFTEEDNSAGLNLIQAVDGSLIDDGNWVIVPSATGTIGWWRWRWFLTDPGTTDPYYPRIDGSYGEGLVLSTSSLTSGYNVAIQSFLLDLIGE